MGQMKGEEYDWQCETRKKNRCNKFGVGRIGKNRNRKIVFVEAEYSTSKVLGGPIQIRTEFVTGDIL